MTFAHNKRLLFGAAALLCYGAAIVLAPSGARSQFNARTRIADIAEPRIDPAPPAIAPEGDAFAPRAPVDDNPPPALRIAPPRLPQLPEPHVAPPLVPAVVSSHVAAIVTGTHPTAIVNSAEGSKLVSVGDGLDGSSVIEITSDTVVLANGKRLTLEPAATP